MMLLCNWYNTISQFITLAPVKVYHLAVGWQLLETCVYILQLGCLHITTRQLVSAHGCMLALNAVTTVLSHYLHQNLQPCSFNFALKHASLQIEENITMELCTKDFILKNRLGY